MNSLPSPAGEGTPKGGWTARSAAQAELSLPGEQKMALYDRKAPQSIERAERFGEALKRDGNADSRLFRLEDDKDGRVAGL